MMKIFWIIGALFLAVGLGMLTGGFFVWRAHATFAAHALHAEGIVVDQATSAGSKGGTLYSPVVEFSTSDGRQIRVTGSVSSSSPSYARGDHVAVLYDPANPEQARLDSFTEAWFATLIMAGLGSVFALIGGGMVYAQLRQRKVRAWLAQNGMRVQAKFDGVVYDTSLTVNGRNPWRLNCQWQHPATQKVYMFRSDPIWFDPTPFVKRDTLDVLVNVDNPKQYQIDTAFLPQAG
jgi:hypothetical protein